MDISELSSEEHSEPKSTALHALPNLLHSSPLSSAGAQHQWSHIPVWGPKQGSDR